MRIKVTDITAEGRELHFEIDRELLNSRISSVSANTPDSLIDSQNYRFEGDTLTELRLTVEGSTVVVKGRVRGCYCSVCARCAEDCRSELSTEVHMHLKPRQQGGPEGSQDEDLQFGYYDGGEVDCGAIVEECIILALPQTVVCSEQCKGLCTCCGGNLNQRQCDCATQQAGDERFAVLRDFKVVQ